MKTEKIKMSDIAKELNISTISVSRALSGQTGVSEELRNRILLKAGEMGYLRTKNQRDYKILVLHRKPFVQDNSNYSYMIQGLEKAMQTAGFEYDIEFVDKNIRDELEMPQRVIKGTRYDGIVFIGSFDRAYIDLLAQKFKNYVLYTGYSPAGDCDCVWYNFNNGSYRLCDYLISKGHRRIGYLGYSDGYVRKEKILGLVSALEDHHLNVEPEFFICGKDGAEQKIYELIQRGNGPTAVICQWDYAAVKLIQYLFDKGIRVPDELSVVGSGNAEMSSLCIPPLTTLELHIDDACASVVNLLLKRFEKPNKPAESVLINSSLIKRDSVKPIK